MIDPARHHQKHYTLFNNANKRYLTHRKVGIWYTDNIKEAEEMLEACKKYIDSLGLPKFAEEIFISEINEEEFEV